MAQSLDRNGRPIPNNATVQVTEISRLSAEVYDSLERKHNTFKPTSTSTELEAGYALGVQAVLKDLRLGFVIGR